LLDLGFYPSFARNVSYVMSGVRDLKTNGFLTVETGNTNLALYLLLQRPDAGQGID